MAISDLSEEQFKTYARESKNWKEFMLKCGYTNVGCRQYIKKKIELFEIDISHFTNIRRTKKYTDEELFKENSEYSNMVGIKKRLIKKFGWKYECSNCKLSEWMNQPIPIEIDHINGTHTDNRMENLRFLCPNCHALTDTYKGKNTKNKDHSKEKYEKLKNKRICTNCNKPKLNNSEMCKECHIKIKLHKSNKCYIKMDKKKSNCIDCNKKVQKGSERCIECYKKAKKNGTFEKKVNKHTKKCPDCENLISNDSIRCRLCHYTIMRLKSDIGDKIRIKGKCLDCDTVVDGRAIRCITCSNKTAQIANRNVSKNCTDCNIVISNTAKRCNECHIIHSRKVIRPSYEQLLEDKETLSMVKIGKKYGVSDNTIRDWINKYKNEKELKDIVIDIDREKIPPELL
jgi:hypothetical protein